MCRIKFRHEGKEPRADLFLDVRPVGVWTSPACVLAHAPQVVGDLLRCYLRTTGRVRVVYDASGPLHVATGCLHGIVTRAHYGGACGLGRAPRVRGPSRGRLRRAVHRRDEIRNREAVLAVGRRANVLGWVRREVVVWRAVRIRRYDDAGAVRDRARRRAPVNRNVDVRRDAARQVLGKSVVRVAPVAVVKHHERLFAGDHEALDGI